MTNFFDIDFDKIYPKPSDSQFAIIFFNDLWMQLHAFNFSLLLTFYGKHRCLTKGNKVLMADGIWKNIEDVMIGDSVLSPQRDGSVVSSKVLQVTNYFCNDVYDVIEAKGKNKLLYSCSNNHNIPLLCYCSKRKDPLPRDMFRKIKEYPAEYISTIKTAMQSRMITFTTPPIDFKQKDTEINPYCLGLWLGDGGCTVVEREYSESFLEKNPLKRNDKSIYYVFTITTNDPEIICSFKQRYNEINSIGTKQGTTAVAIRITSKGLFFKQLQKLGLIGTKSGTKFIPKECLLSSIDFRLQLLAGLIDTDGYINHHSNNIEITSKSLKLANDILDIVCSLGGNGTVTKIKKKIKSIDFEGTYYTARFAFSKELLPELIKYVQVKRKKQRMINHVDIANNTNSNHKNYDPRNISIRCISSKPQMVYGFTLDSESHWFITNNWIVTCNSGKSLAAVLFAYILDPTFEENLEKRVVYTSQDFLKATNELRQKKIKGGAIIKDEAGTGDLSSQRWYEESAKIINAQLQAIGYLNPFIEFVTQNFNFINTQARRLSQGVFEVTRKTNRYSNIKPFWIESNPWSTGFIHKYPVYYERYNDIVSSRYKINNIKVNLPPKDLVDRYEQHSQAYKDALSDDAVLDIDSIVSKRKSEQRKSFKALAGMADDIVGKPDDYVVRRKSDKAIKKFDEYLIMHQLEVSLNEAKTIKALAEKKFFA